MKTFFMLRYSESGQIRDRTAVIYAADLAAAKTKLLARHPGIAIADAVLSAAASGFRGAGGLAFTSTRVVPHTCSEIERPLLVQLDGCSVVSKLSPADVAELEQDFQGV